MRRKACGFACVSGWTQLRVRVTSGRNGMRIPLSNSACTAAGSASGASRAKASCVLSSFCARDRQAAHQHMCGGHRPAPRSSRWRTRLQPTTPRRDTHTDTHTHTRLLRRGKVEHAAVLVEKAARARKQQFGAALAVPASALAPRRERGAQEREAVHGESAGKKKKKDAILQGAVWNDRVSRSDNSFIPNSQPTALTDQGRCPPTDGDAGLVRRGGEGAQPTHRPARCTAGVQRPRR